MKSLLDRTTVRKLLCSLMESYGTLLQYLQIGNRIQGCQSDARVFFFLLIFFSSYKSFKWTKESQSIHMTMNQLCVVIRGILEYVFSFLF